MASIKVAYGTTANLTFTSLNSLAASASWLAGAESTAVDNTSNLFTDYLLSGKVVAAASNNQAGTIEVHVVGMLDDTNWPDVFDGTDSAETVASAGIKGGICRPVAVIAGENSANRVYNFGPVSVANAFGGSMPRKFVVFITHNIQTSTNGWASTGHQVTVTPVYYTSA
jgi:hypothetical protein